MSSKFDRDRLYASVLGLLAVLQAEMDSTSTLLSCMMMVFVAHEIDIQEAEEEARRQYMAALLAAEEEEEEEESDSEESSTDEIVSIDEDTN